jgi:hypothetical protein
VALVGPKRLEQDVIKPLRGAIEPQAKSYGPTQTLAGSACGPVYVRQSNGRERVVRKASKAGSGIFTPLDVKTTPDFPRECVHVLPWERPRAGPFDPAAAPAPRLFQALIEGRREHGAGHDRAADGDDRTFTYDEIILASFALGFGAEARHARRRCVGVMLSRPAGGG